MTETPAPEPDESYDADDTVVDLDPVTDGGPAPTQDHQDDPQ